MLNFMLIDFRDAREIRTKKHTDNEIADFWVNEIKKASEENNAN